MNASNLIVSLQGSLDKRLLVVHVELVPVAPGHDSVTWTDCVLGRTPSLILTCTSSTMSAIIRYVSTIGQGVNQNGPGLADGVMQGGSLSPSSIICSP